jgi:hypothetical protein
MHRTGHHVLLADLVHPAAAIGHQPAGPGQPVPDSTSRRWLAYDHGVAPSFRRE